MIHPERRIRSIPPKTSLDVLRGGITIRIGGGSLLGDARRVSRVPTSIETDWSKEAAKHVFQKSPGREKARPELSYKWDGKIKWETEVMEDYDGKGGLGIISQFDGVKLTNVPFLRSRHNKPERPVFYIQISWHARIACLFLATTKDIFESQIVPAQMDINPFFQDELYLPQLSTPHDPASMTVFLNNELVTVGYNPRTY